MIAGMSLLHVSQMNRSAQKTQCGWCVLGWQLSPFIQRYSKFRFVLVVLCPYVIRGLTSGMKKSHDKQSSIDFPPTRNLHVAFEKKCAFLIM